MSEPNANAIPSTRAANRSRTHKLTISAMLSGVAFLLMFIEFPIPALIPSFVKLDVSDLPELLAAFSLGPVYGVAVALLKNLLFLVLHGTSGVPDDAVRECVARGMCKVNYATDLRIAFSKGLKEYLAKDPEVFDPKKYSAVGREYVKEYVKSKILVCGSNGKA